MPPRSRRAGRRVPKYDEAGSDGGPDAAPHQPIGRRLEHHGEQRGEHDRNHDLGDHHERQDHDRHGEYNADECPRGNSDAARDAAGGLSAALLFALAVVGVESSGVTVMCVSAADVNEADDGSQSSVRQ
jgi:hypothetical protein